MRQSSVDSKPTGADLKQRHLFLLLYITCAAFLAAFVLTTRLHTRWHQPAHVLTLAIGAFAVWSLYRLLILTDERQRKTNNDALRFGFLATLVLLLLGGFIRGFSSPALSWGGLLGVMLVAWSVGLIVSSWRYR
jgi:glycerol uptake facilitator-like aquaporin